MASTHVFSKEEEISNSITHGIGVLLIGCSRRIDPFRFPLWECMGKFYIFGAQNIIYIRSQPYYMH